MFKLPQRLRGPAVFVLTMLAVEFLDEFVFGAREAAWPLIRADLNLSYAQIGLLLTLPSLFASVVEPALGLLADTPKRRAIVLGGGLAFAAGTLLMAASAGFVPLLLAFMLLYPASGAFVSLSQATLMESEPTRHQHNMARWTFAGSVGVVGGSLGLGALVALGLGWRVVFAAAAVLAVALVILMTRRVFPTHVHSSEDEEPVSFDSSVRGALAALRRGDVLRWLVLLEFSNLMLDILYGYLALYFVDVAGLGMAEAALAVSVWTVVGLLGDFLLIPLLERVQGLTYLRWSAVLELILFVAFLLTPGLPAKLVLVAALGFFNSGWYSILMGELYSSLPGRSGAVLAISNVAGLLGGLIPLIIGLLAEHFGLNIAMWSLLLGPIALLVGLPRTGLTIEQRSALPSDVADGE